MKSIFQEFKKTGNIHHAYLIEGEEEGVLAELILEIENGFGIVSLGNPDFFVAHYETLGIDESRELKRKQSEKTFGGERKIFVISVGAFTREAQNSLLKVFEEPTPMTHFFVVIKDARTILSTLRSRMVIVSKNKNDFLENSEMGEIVEKFLKSEPTSRLQMPFIKKLITDKDREKTVIFMDNLQVALGRKINDKAISKEEVNTLETIIKLRGYLNDRSPSIKMIVEYLAITV